MLSYLIETYLPRAAQRDPGRLAARARAAVEELSAAGVAIHYVRTTFVPEDETCFHVVDAAERQIVDELCRRAGIENARVVQAVDASRV